MWGKFFDILSKIIIEFVTMARVQEFSECRVGKTL